MNVTIQLIKKPRNFLQSIIKYMKGFTNFHIITQETYKFFRNYNKIHEKNIQISIQLLKKHTNVYQNKMKNRTKKLKYFIT